MALFRAIESAGRPGDRLFVDPLARRFLPSSLRMVARLAALPLAGAALTRWIDRRWPGARSSGVARTRLIDELLARALAGGVRQVVILGAGFDCRAYRVPGTEHARVYEVDHPTTQQVKHERLARVLGTLPAHVRFVGVDLDHDDLARALERAGWDPALPSFFVCEGVTNYLDAASVDALVRLVGHAAPSSTIAFTYVDRALLDGAREYAGQDAIMATVVRAGEPWTFGLAPGELRSYLAERGLELVEDLGAAEYRERYFGAAARAMRGYEFYRAAVARVPGAPSNSSAPGHVQAG